MIKMEFLTSLYTSFTLWFVVSIITFHPNGNSFENICLASIDAFLVTEYHIAQHKFGL